MHAEPTVSTGGPSRPRRGGTAARIAAVAVVLGLGAGLGVRAASGGVPAPAAGGQAAGAPRAVPGGMLTLLDHRRVSLASLRGGPVLVWFVAAGCPSCEASIPVVASHLGAFTRAGTRVLVLGTGGAGTPARRPAAR